MNKKINLIAVLFIVFSLFSCKTSENISKKDRPELQFPLSAKEIYTNYSTNQELGNELYKNRLLIITGKVTELYKNKEGLVVIVLDSSDRNFGVSCTMYNNEQIKRPLKVGETLKIKGFCLGKKDHILVGKCVILP